MEVAYFQMRVAVEKEMVVAVGMYTHSELVGVGMVLNSDDQVLVHVVKGLNVGLAVVVLIRELCILVGVEEEG